MTVNLFELPQFFETAEEILSGKKPDLIITKDLSFCNKRSFRWKILCLLQPFFQLFGKDVYSHVRANHVAQGILRICQQYRNQFSNRRLLLGKIEKQILQPLKVKTRGKFNSEIDETITELYRLIEEPQEQSPPLENSFHNPLRRVPQDLTLEKGTKIIWPSDSILSQLEISPSTLSSLRENLLAYCKEITENPTYNLKFVKKDGLRSLRLVDSNVWDAKQMPILKETVISVSLEVVRSPTEQIRDVVILAKKILAKGGQTTVRLCWSLFRGALLVRKACHSSDEQIILNHFRQVPTRGIVPVFHLRSRRGAKKIQVLEDLLHPLDGNVKTFTDIDRLVVAEDLVHGICAIHRQGLAHRDLKPLNILVQEVEGKWRGFITDFGFVDVKLIGGSIGFRSPEQIRESNIVSRLVNGPRQSKYYYPGDMWSMGLVLHYLFLNRENFTSTLPPFILKRISRQPHAPSALQDDEILKLPQEEIDAWLGMISRLQLMPKQTEKWLKLIGRMLRKDPSERISSEDAVKAISQAKDVS